MILIALLLFSAGRVTIIDDTIRVPPSQWRAVDVMLRQHAATVECSFAVAEGSPGVQVALMSLEDAGRLRDGRAYRNVVETAYGPSGSFRAAVPCPGDYVLVIDNRRAQSEPAEVHLQVALAFYPVETVPVRLLSIRRRAAVIIVSLGFFAAICLYAARKLRGG